MTFRELAVLLNYNGPSSAEKAYRRAVEKLESCPLGGRVRAIPAG